MQPDRLPVTIRRGGEESPRALYYGYAQTPVGQWGVFRSAYGICKVAFTEEAVDYDDLQRDDHMAEELTMIAFGKMKALDPVQLYLSGTPFQQSVWQELLRIPAGQTITYKELAEKIKKPNAHRAVGTAVGQNPIACLIPCHRVVPAAGGIGNYRWGAARKQVLLAQEQ